MNVLLRITAATTAFCFVGTQALIAAPDAFQVASRTSPGGPADGRWMSPSEVNSLVQWHVPESFGSVQERWRGASQKVVFHIQDTHANYESQTHTAQILEMLFKGRFKNKIRLIAVEGAAGRIDVDPLKVYPDKDTLKKIADHFLREAVITGTEFFSIFNEDALFVHGIEDLDLYVEDLKDFVLSQVMIQEIGPIMDGLQDAFSKTHGAIYNEQALEFMDFLAGYQNGDVRFSAYCEGLARYAQAAGLSTSPYSTFEKIIESIHVEKAIDSEKVEKERGDLIAALEKKMVKEDLSQLVGKGLLFRTGRISSGEFYGLLQSIADRYQIQWDEFPNLAGYIQMVQLQQGIKTKELFFQCEWIETGIKEKWLKSSSEKDFDAASKKLKTLEKLVHLKMSRADLDFYKKHKDTVQAVSLANFLRKTLTKVAVQNGNGWKIQTPKGSAWIEKGALADVDLIDEKIGSMQAFYQKALLRDDAIVRNTLRLMEEQELDAAVLVTGGFHTEGTMKHFKDQGISYVVVNPRLTKTDQEELYLARMLNDELPLENFFSRVGNRIAIPLISSTVPIKVSEDLPNGELFKLDTETKQTNFFHSVRLMYLAAATRKIIEQKGTVTRQDLIRVVNGLATDDQMPMLVNIKEDLQGDYQVLFALSSIYAEEKGLPEKMVLKVPGANFEELVKLGDRDVESRAITLAELEQVPYSLIEIGDSVFAPTLVASQVSPAVVVEDTEALIDALGRLAKNPEDEVARKAVTNLLGKRAEGMAAGLFQSDILKVLSPEKVDVKALLASNNLEDIDEKAMKIWNSFSVSQAEATEVAATGTDATVPVSASSRPIARKGGRGLQAIGEAMLLAQIRRDHGQENPALSQLIQGMLLERMSVANEETSLVDLSKGLGPNAVLPLVGTRLLGSIVKEKPEAQLMEMKRYALLSDLLSRMRREKWSEARYNEMELIMAKEYGLSPEAIMYLYLDSHPQASPIEQHARLQSIFLRYPDMSEASMRLTILALFDGNPTLQEAVAESLVVVDGHLTFANSAEKIAEDAGVYEPIDNVEDLPKEIQKGQAVVNALMHDMAEIRRHVTSVTKTIAIEGEILGLAPDLMLKALAAGQHHDHGKAVRAVFIAITVPRNLKPDERAIIGLHDEYSGIIIEAIREVPFLENAGKYRDAIASKIRELNAKASEGRNNWQDIAEDDVLNISQRIATLPEEVVQEVKDLSPQTLSGITGHHGKGFKDLEDEPESRLINYLIQIADDMHAMHDARRYVMAEGGKNRAFILDHFVNEETGCIANMLKKEEKIAATGKPTVEKQLKALRAAIRAKGLGLFGKVLNPYADVLKLDVVEQILEHRKEHPPSQDVADAYREHAPLAEAVVNSNLRFKDNDEISADGEVSTQPEQKNRLLEQLLLHLDDLPPPLREWIEDPIRGPPVILNIDSYLDLSPAQRAAIQEGAPVIMIGRAGEEVFKFNRLPKLHSDTASNIYAYYPDSPNMIQNVGGRLELGRKLKPAQSGEWLSDEEFVELISLTSKLKGWGIPQEELDAAVQKAKATRAAVNSVVQRFQDVASRLEEGDFKEALKIITEIRQQLNQAKPPESFWKGIVVKAQTKKGPLAASLVLNEALAEYPDNIPWRRTQKDLLRGMEISGVSERGPPLEEGLSREQISQLVQVALYGPESSMGTLDWEIELMIEGLDRRVGRLELLQIMMESRLQIVGKKLPRQPTEYRVHSLDGVNGDLFHREIVIRMIRGTIIQRHADVIEAVVIGGTASGDALRYKVDKDMGKASDYDFDVLLRRGLNAKTREAKIREIKRDADKLIRDFGLKGHDMVGFFVAGLDVISSNPEAWLNSPEKKLSDENEDEDLEILGRSLTLSYIVNWTAEVYYLARGAIGLPRIWVTDPSEGFEFALMQLRSFKKQIPKLKRVGTGERVEKLAKYILRSADGYLASLGMFMNPADIEAAKAEGLVYEESLVQRSEAALSQGKPVFTEEQLKLLNLLKRIRLGEEMPEGWEQEISLEQMQAFMLTMLEQSWPSYQQGMRGAFAEGKAYAPIKLDAAEQILRDIKVPPGTGEEMLALLSGGQERASQLVKQMEALRGVIANEREQDFQAFQDALAKYLETKFLEDLHMVMELFKPVLRANPALDGVTFNVPKVNASLSAGSDEVSAFFRHEVGMHLIPLKGLRDVAMTKISDADSALLEDLDGLALRLRSMAGHLGTIGSLIPSQEATPEAQENAARLRAWFWQEYWGPFSQIVDNLLARQAQLRESTAIPENLSSLRDSADRGIVRLAIARDQLNWRVFGKTPPRRVQEVSVDTEVNLTWKLVYGQLKEKFYKEHLALVRFMFEETDGLGPQTMDMARFYSPVENLMRNAVEEMLINPLSLHSVLGELLNIAERGEDLSESQFEGILQLVGTEGISEDALRELLNDQLGLLREDLASMRESGSPEKRLNHRKKEWLKNTAQAIAFQVDRERIESGQKPVVLTVRTSKNADAELVLEVSDTGQGIDVKALYAGIRGRMDTGEVHADSEVAQAIRDLGDDAKVRTALEADIIEDALSQRIMNLLFLSGLTVGKAGGTGIGLQEVYANVDGRVQVASTLGEGTTFTLTFPTERADLQPPVAPTRPGKPSIEPPIPVAVGPEQIPVSVQRPSRLTDVISAVAGFGLYLFIKGGVIPADSRTSEISKVLMGGVQAGFVTAAVWRLLDKLRQTRPVTAIETALRTRRGLVTFFIAAGLAGYVLSTGDTGLGELAAVFSSGLGMGSLDLIEREAQTEEVAIFRDGSLSNVSEVDLRDRREEIRKELKSLFEADRLIFKGILEEGAKGFDFAITQLIELHPETVLRVLLDRDPALVDSMVSDLVKDLAQAYVLDQKRKVAIALSDVDRAQLLRRWNRLKSGLIGAQEEKSVKVIHLEHFIDENGELRDPDAFYQALWTSEDAYLIGYKMSEAEFNRHKVKLEEKFGKIQVKGMIFAEGPLSGPFETRKFRDRVITKVSRETKLPERSIFVLPTPEAYRDIWMQDAGNILIALFDSNRRELLLTGSEIDALKRLGLSGLEETLTMVGDEGGEPFMLVPETRTTMEEKYLQAKAVALSA